MMNKGRKSIVFTGLLALAGLGLAVAQHKDEPEASGHSHDKAAAHGGTVTMTKEFHFETVFGSDQIRVYMYDAMQNPMQIVSHEGSVVQAVVSIEFKGHDREKVRIRLRPPNDNGHMTDMDRGAHSRPTEGDDAQGHGHEAKKGDHEAEHGHGNGAKSDTQDYLVAKIDLSGVASGEAKAVFIFQNLPGRREKEARFTQKVKRAASKAESQAGHGDHGEASAHEDEGEHGHMEQHEEHSEHSEHGDGHEQEAASDEGKNDGHDDGHEHDHGDE